MFTPLQGPERETGRVYWVIDRRHVPTTPWERLGHATLGLLYYPELQAHDAVLLGNDYGILTEGKALEILAALYLQQDTLAEASVGYAKVEYRVCRVYEIVTVRHVHPTLTVGHSKES